MEPLATGIADFHFLRPWWFAGLLPAVILFWWQHRRAGSSGEWSSVIDPQLLPYMLDRQQGVKHNYALLWLFGWALAVTALAGPTWQQTALPVHKQESALVVLFDLSPSMLAQDVTPNRLTRARLKLIDILNQRKEGTTALIAYAGDAFTVSPLTDDAKTVAALVPALHPGIMPEAGSNTEAAVEQALALFSNAGQSAGAILIITDGITTEARQSIAVQLRDKLPVDVSVLAVGTEEGAPIPLGNGSFVKDRNGAIVLPALEPGPLRKLARRLEGRYTELTTDDSDINYLTEGFATALAKDIDSTEQLERTFDSWNDQGFWLAILCLPLLALSFRRGVVAGGFTPLLLSAALLGSPQQARAFSWGDLWQRPDQQGAKAFAAEDYAKARQAFNNQQWQAASAYRSGDYDAATELFNNGSATADYNRGNALARAGKFREAIASYRQALDKKPDLEDAEYNKALLEELLKQQQQSEQQQQNQNQDNPEQDQGENSKQDADQNQTQQNQQQNDQSGQSRNEQQDSKTEQDSRQQAESQGQEQPQEEQTEEQKPGEQPQAKRPQQQEERGEQQQAQPSEASESMSDEEKQAAEQWLRRIPDDPGGLLRQKFKYESKKRAERRTDRLPPTQQAEQRW